LTVPTADEPPPVVRLAPCGSAKVRLVDAAGKPVAGNRVQVWAWLADDHPAGPATAAGRGCHAYAASSVDPRSYVPGPATGVDGVVRLPALVPGLQYSVRFADPAGRSIATPPFRVRAGETVRLPDVMVPPEPADSQAAGPQAGTTRTESEVPAPK
jgi:hypothetical protein